MTPSTLDQRVAVVQRRILAACEAAGRSRSDVQLLAASKTRSPDAIAALHALGHTLFGENRAQELRDKVEPVGALADARGDERPDWHFIGHLQSNKVKYIVGRASLVHSVDRLAVATALSARVVRQREAGKSIDEIGVLVEVNVSGEASKSGVSPAGALELCAAVAALPGVEIRGLMTMPPLTDDPAASRPFFDRLAKLADQGRANGLALDHLSMGMSRDFEHAIAAGSTLIRVGTDLFGPRG